MNEFLYTYLEAAHQTVNVTASDITLLVFLALICGAFCTESMFHLIKYMIKRIKEKKNDGKL